MSETLRCQHAQSDVVALGIAANMLHDVLPFSKLSVPNFIGTLIGQISRKHYVFTFQGEKILGYAGWALCSEDVGRRFAEGSYHPTYEEGLNGDCVVLITFYADTPEVAWFQTRFCRNQKPYSPFFARRQYPNGRARAVILPGRRNPESP